MADSESNHPVTNASSFRRRWWIFVLKLLVVVVVGVGVSGTVRDAIAELSRHAWQLHAGWLGISGMLYLAGLAAMAWFWHHALSALGQPVPFVATLRVYFLGHLGKYVPGKAMVVILRVAGVRRWVASLRIAVVSTLLETLTMMAVGAFLAAMLAMILLQLPTELTLLATLMALAAGLPTMPPVARWLARLGVTRWKQPKEIEELSPEPSAERRGPAVTELDANLQGISLPLIASGWLAACICWTLLGLSLWATLRSIGLDQLDPLESLPLLIAAVALAVVAGFLSLIPGGILVRDALLMQLLVPYGEANALIAAVLLRLVWLVSELGICGILYAGTREAGR